MIDDKTIYTLLNEDGDKTTIRLDKLTADVLQLSLSDVHTWIQGVFEDVGTEYPDIGRRKKGDIVRAIAAKKAQKSHHYRVRMIGMFGE